MRWFSTEVWRLIKCCVSWEWLTKGLCFFVTSKVSLVNGITHYWGMYQHHTVGRSVNYIHPSTNTHVLHFFLGPSPHSLTITLTQISTYLSLKAKSTKQFPSPFHTSTPHHTHPHTFHSLSIPLNTTTDQYTLCLQVMAVWSTGAVLNQRSVG